MNTSVTLPSWNIFHLPRFTKEMFYYGFEKIFYLTYKINNLLSTLVLND